MTDLDTELDDQLDPPQLRRGVVLQGDEADVDTGALGDDQDDDQPGDDDGPAD